MKRAAVLGISLWSALWAAAGPVSASPAEQNAIRARHKALVAALNRKDLKSARAYYTPDFRAEVGGGLVNLNQHLASLSSMTQGGMGFTLTASLSSIKVARGSAEAVETAEVTFKLPDGASQKLPAQQTRQGWRKVKGAWKLAWEQALVTAASPAPEKPKP
jgi:ketosteroid isomerase-like protein